MISGLLLVMLAVVVQSAGAGLSQTEGDGVDSALELLKSTKFSDRLRGVEQLATSGHSGVLGLLSELLEGRLFYIKKGRRLVIAEEQDGDYRIRDALTGEPLGVEKARKLRKINLNNAMRSRINALVAAIDLASDSPSTRLDAVNRILDHYDVDAVAAIRPLHAVERDEQVRDAMEVAIALADLETGSFSQQVQAVAVLQESVHPAVRNGLVRLKARAGNPELARMIDKSLEIIDARLKVFAALETLFFGLSLGSVLVLAAIGLAITFGVMGVINMAHGELIMLGAYTAYVIQRMMPDHIGISLLVAVPAAFCVSAVVGIAIERGIIRFLYGRPLETLLATFGISLILQQGVRTLFSPLNRSVETPEWMSGALHINSALSLTYNRLYIIAFCLLIFAGLILVLKKTALGLQIRAVSQNRAMARAMGVRSAWVDAMTFGLGSGVAGMAGVALSQLTNVGPNLGQSYIIDSFMVVVFGGVGNLWGTLVSGMTLGVANKFMEPWAGAVLAKILVLVFIVLFIQKRPRGLFPHRGRAAEG